MLDLEENNKEKNFYNKWEKQEIKVFKEKKM
jgi:hypothetical protein